MPSRHHPKLTAPQMSSLLQAVGDYLEDGGAAACVILVGGAVPGPAWLGRAIHAGHRCHCDAPSRLGRVAAARFPGASHRCDPTGCHRPGPAHRLAQHRRRHAVADRATPHPRLRHRMAHLGGLQVGLAGRQAMLALKLFAATDRGPTACIVATCWSWLPPTPNSRRRPPGSAPRMPRPNGQRSSPR